MAIFVQTVIPNGAEVNADRFDQSVEVAMMQTGGPPAGLMAHLAYPAGDGFVLCNVWRSEAEMQSFYDEVVLPKLAEAGLQPEESTVSPVWSFARP